MFFLSHYRIYAQAVLLSVIIFFAAQSVGANSDSSEVVIIGSRFPNAPDLAPIGATVITSTEIQQAGISNANEAIRKLAGVYGRTNVRGTQDFDLDLSGFGSDSANNMVILVDGVRLSESEQIMALLSSIPVDSIARIEIMRGGSSVLYGDGATGGVIEIITKQSGKTPITGTATVEAGQFNLRSGRVWLARGWDDVNVTLNLSDQKSDNYRVNNAVTQKNASGTLSWYFSKTGRAGLRFDLARQDSGFPGSLSLPQFDQNPRQSTTPFDNGSVAMDRYTAFVNESFGDWQAAAELSTRQRTSFANFVSMHSASRYRGRQTEFTPRLRNETSFGDVRNELVAGLDLMWWNRQTTSSYSLDYATQKSSAIYLRNEMKIHNARLAFGARREVFNKTSVDPGLFSVDNYDAVQGVNAWELQGSYSFTPETNVFAKWGQSYRVANVDDNSYTTIPNTPLSPQLSRDMELGAVIGGERQQLTARIFRHDITHEIYFDPLINHGFGANTNLDPTRRQGVALDASWRLSKQFKLSGQAQHVQATFSASGHELVLVPRNTISAYVNWLPGDGQNAYVGVQWIDSQRYGGDFDNTCTALIAAHATLDARYSRLFGDWELAVAGTNLTNTQYFTNAFGCRSAIYPDAGRQMKISLQYKF